MVKVSFTENLQRHVKAPPMSAAAGTVRTVLEQAFSAVPALRSYVLDDQGAVRKHVTVFVDGVQIADRRMLSDAVPDGAEVWVMQALSGGA
jgi:sulfur-carrier protein